jgi:hypothetical protein
MIKIAFDTTSFQDNWLAQGEAFTLLEDFIAKGEAKGYVSEITVLEHLRHREEQGPALVKKAEVALSKVSDLLTESPVPKLPALRDAATFESEFRSRLKRLGIEIMPFPAVSHSILVKRDLARLKPFDPNGKGYRDALIWLGFLDVLDSTTEKVIFVTNNTKDFCGSGETELHTQLITEIQQRSLSCSALLYASPKALVEGFVRPRLRALAELEVKTQEILSKIKSDDYPHFNLAKVVAEGLETFEAQEGEGIFFADDVPLEEPIYVTMVNGPENVEATALYRLKGGTFVCEGTAEVTATVQGFLDKFEAFNQSELGVVFISTANWNDHYSEVEVTDVPATITFSFEFEAESPEVLTFETIKVESLH